MGQYTPLREQMGNRTKVAIVGFCESSREFTPYGDPDMEVWGLNRGALFMPNADRWFEMHSDAIVAWQQRRPGRHVDWLNAFPGPVYMHQAVEYVKNSVAYPLQELADFFGRDVHRVGHMVKDAKPQSASGGPERMVVEGPQDVRDTTGEPYLTSSIAYELALAIYEGFSEIHLYGVDLVTEAEYAWQKPGVEFLLGWAAGHHIKVVLPANCPLLQGKLYGRGYMSERPEEMSYETLAQRLSSLDTQQQQTEIKIAQYQGALSELVNFTQAQILPGIEHEKLDDRRKWFEQQITTLNHQLASIQGARQETAHWMHQTMTGQEPKEAIEQLRRFDQTELVAEGPTDDLEEMQHRDGNGRLTEDDLELIGVAPV